MTERTMHGWTPVIHDGVKYFEQLCVRSIVWIGDDRIGIFEKRRRSSRPRTIRDEVIAIAWIIDPSTLRLVTKLDFIQLTYRRRVGTGGSGKIVERNMLASISDGDPDTALDACLAMPLWREPDAPDPPAP